MSSSPQSTLIRGARRQERGLFKSIHNTWLGVTLAGLLFLSSWVHVMGQPVAGGMPVRATFEAGAQIWIEPGQTPEQIDGWFARLASEGMTVTRLFIMWNYIEQPDGRQDYSLYDACFTSGQRHGVRIVATLMPNLGPPSGDRAYWLKTQEGSIPKTKRQLKGGEAYIRRTVERYRYHPALDTWMLGNEPGQMPSPDTLALEAFRGWLSAKYGQIDRLNRAWLTSYRGFDAIEYSPNWAKGGWTWPTSYMDWQVFWRQYMTDYLAGVARQVRAIDPAHEIHVNPHALVDIPHRYELPRWRSFLTSLGASIHPVWHLTAYDRADFPLGVSYVCDLVRGASAPQPFWVTELQGGLNLYTANPPMTPTPAEIESWMWTSATSGARRIIFWCLNPRSQGTEAAEWTMLGLRGQPTARYKTAGQVTRTIRAHDSIIGRGQPLVHPVTLLLSAHTRLLQERAAQPTDPSYRGAMAHQLELMGFHKALSALGCQISIRYLDDSLLIDQASVSGQRRELYVLPHATALTDQDIRTLAALKGRGHHLLVTGLSAIYTPEERSRLLIGPTAWDTLMGGHIEEMIAPSVDTRPLGAATPRRSTVTLPAPGFRAALSPRGRHGQGQDRLPKTVSFIGQPAREGQGATLWLPAMVGLGAWEGDPLPLARYLSAWMDSLGLARPMSFDKPVAGVQVRSIGNGKSYVTALVNRSRQPQTVNLAQTGGRRARAIYYPAGWQAGVGRSFVIPPGQTVALLWTR